MLPNVLALRVNWRVGMSQILKSLILAICMLVPATTRAQTPPPPSPATQVQLPGYLLVVGKTTDRAKIGGYAAALPPIYAQNDAYYLAIGGAGRGVTWLEGPWADRSIIFGKFPSRAQIDAFWWGDAYRAAIRRRDNAGVFSVVALTGTAPLMLEGVGTGYVIVMTGPRDTSANQARLSQEASLALRDGVLASGGTLLTSTEAGQFTSLEGDTLFDRFIIAAWPSLAARDAYLASRPAQRAARLRARLGTSAVASANGVPRTQAPPAATPTPR
jgi:uncharacterized protein (DUF1330 family)